MVCYNVMCKCLHECVIVSSAMPFGIHLSHKQQRHHLVDIQCWDVDDHTALSHQCFFPECNCLTAQQCPSNDTKWYQRKNDIIPTASQALILFCLIAQSCPSNDSKWYQRKQARKSSEDTHFTGYARFEKVWAR